ncbi:AMP-binding protein [Pseudonocardia acidicola]|uniref:AMP-binding protein n=1 Tax=Pseudonocardia acidicola TaxID=2724939 RepID=A0ABX1SKP6_9PSEU|nr:AMP-binding protein [Pseudonocardia acidicola]NMI01113.1 AMP-binding protein [Pseudonocardia acidicola]
MTARRLASEPGLLRGTGPGFGPLARRFPYEQRTLLHVLAARAEERPEKDWLVFDGGADERDRLTFRGAQEQAYRFAAALRDTGFTTTALLLRNQREFMPAFLGTQAAGGVAAPLNPELRGPLLATVLGRCGAQVLVVRADLLDALAGAPSLAGVRLVLVCGDTAGRASVHGVSVVALDEWCAGRGTDPPAALPGPSDLATLVFTSGTSGGSKAAMWPHHYLYLSSAAVSDSLGHTQDDVLSTPLQMCHIAGLQVFAGSALQVGCTAHLKSRFSVQTWWEEIAADGATFAMLMGQMAAMILDAVPAAPEHRLGHVYILPQPAGREEFERRYGTTVIWQGWGMTEIFPHVPSKHRIEDVPADTIGPAPSWVDYGVVDEHDRLLAPGELGEMVYRPLVPDSMARGYYGDPEATNRAFRNFMFHTGDLGYYDELGRVHFVMRNQDAIRRRGENISAVELENVTRGHPDVLDAAAYAVPSELGEHEVKLDVLTRDSLDLDGLHAWLVEQLPRFMVPRYLERRAEFPRTLSQRVEKYKLAREGVDRPEVREYAAPRRASTVGQP